MNSSIILRQSKKTIKTVRQRAECGFVWRFSEKQSPPSESGKSDDSHDFNFRPFLTDTDYDCVDEIGFSAAAASVDVVRGMTGVPGLTWG